MRKDTEHGSAMEEIIYYLEMKNRFYEKFLSISEKFLNQIQHEQWDNVEYFVDSRERILNIIRSYDLRIAELFQQVDAEFTPLDAYSGRVRNLLERREVLGKRILNQDLELIGKVDEARAETIRELKQTQETGQRLSSYASPTPPAPKRSKLPRDI